MPMTRKNYGKLKKALSANPGGLHRALGVPEGQTIPPGMLQAARHTKKARRGFSATHIRQMANLANTAKGFKHKKSA